MRFLSPTRLRAPLEYPVEASHSNRHKCSYSGKIIIITLLSHYGLGVPHLPAVSPISLLANDLRRVSASAAYFFSVFPSAPSARHVDVPGYLV